MKFALRTQGVDVSVPMEFYIHRDHDHVKVVGELCQSVRVMGV